MKLPRKVRKGENFLVMYDLWNNLIDYLLSCRLVAGSRISLQKYPSGTVISAAKQSGAGGCGGSEAPFEYAGPWSLSYSGGSYINVKPGLVWTPGGAFYGLTSFGLARPAVSSFIVVQRAGSTYYSNEVFAMADDGNLARFTSDNPHYWDTHAILGRYDAETDTVTQYHFSPIVFLLETEDFVVEP